MDAFIDDLPESIYNRKKMGFVLPYEKWMKNELKTFCESNLNQLKTFASSYGKNVDLNVALELGIEEQTIAIGLTSAVVGSIGLAAGWQTLTYAMLNFFHPIALFAVLGTVLFSIFTK